MSTHRTLPEAIVFSLLAALAISFIVGIAVFHLLQSPIEYGHINEVCIGCAVFGVYIGGLLFLSVFFFLFRVLYKLKPKAKRIFTIVYVVLLVAWASMIVPILLE